MSRLGDIAIGVIIGVGGIIGAALAFDKYENTDGSDSSNKFDVNDKEVNVDAENEGKKVSTEGGAESFAKSSSENNIKDCVDTQTEQDINSNEPLISN